MTVRRDELESCLNGLLMPERFQDYCPNGLQVEGRDHIDRIVTGVTASQALIDAAVDAGADAILVHHGWFWKGESLVLVGMRRKRMATLLGHDLNLFAYHLPLDAHPELGNNAQLAGLMDWTIGGGMQADTPLEMSMGMRGNCAPLDGADFASRLHERLGRAPLHIPGSAKQITRIAWCTGAAQSMIEQAVDAGVDAYVTGEVSEQTVHVARETGLHFFAAGHHASERYGVQAVGSWLEKQLAVEVQFIDVDNPA